MEKELTSVKMQERSGTAQETAPYEDLYEREEPKEKTRHLILFRLNREWYGVEITKVREVIKTGKITYLPSSPEHIVGIVTRKGNILSVTDLKTTFGLPHEGLTEKARIIAVESGILETGFLVDEVVESIEVPISKIEPPLPTLPAERRRYIEGQCRSNNKLVALISVEMVFQKKG